MRWLGGREPPLVIRCGLDLTCVARYYASSALDSIHRGVAVEAWSSIDTVGLDRALGAFDMFVLHDQPQDLDYVSADACLLAAW